MAWQSVHVEFPMKGAPAEAQRTWQATTTAWLGKYRLVAQTPDTLTYSRTYIPGFAIVLSIFLFPIGLLALLAKREAPMTIAFRPHGEDSLVSVTATANPDGAVALRRLAEDWTATYTR